MGAEIAGADQGDVAEGREHGVARALRALGTQSHIHDANLITLYS